MKLYHYISILLVLVGCVEPIEIDTGIKSSIQIEELLVVEGTFTNELKQHSVSIRKGASFSQEEGSVVENASVSIIDNQGNSFAFFQSEPGNYLSENAIRALPNTEYQLQIQLDGKTYNSTFESLPSVASIDAIYAQRMTNNLGIDGVGIFINTQITANTPPLLRFTYEETYKIIAPLWSPLDMVVLDRNPPYEFGLVPKEEEKRICFGFQASNEILQSEGLELTGNSVDNIMVRFIPGDDFIISHRYSILVEQLSQSPNAFAFYSTLNELSSSGNVFSDIQPGFLEGNLQNVNDADEKVIGYFEVAYQSQKRLFFDYEEFYPDNDLPPYVINCNFLGAPMELSADGVSSPLLSVIDSGLFVYVRDNDGQVEGGGPFLTARRACGDCTALGSNVVPDFWLDE